MADPPHHLQLSEALPCAHCGAPATLAAVCAVGERFPHHAAALRGWFLIQPLCTRCIEQQTQPVEHGLCAVRQWLEERGA